MARTTNDNNLKPVIDAYQQWIRDCLVGDGSIFSSASLWTLEHVAEVKKSFVDHPDTGPDDFPTKLNRQMKNASATAKQLMAEMLWALLAWPTSEQISVQTKVEQIEGVWSLSGAVLPKSSPMLSEEVLDGIGSGGIGYNNNRWRELTFLIELTSYLKQRTSTDREKLFSDYQAFLDWMEQVPMVGNRQFRHMLRYVAFPDRVERMSSNGERHAVLAGYGIAPKKETKKWTDGQLDGALFKLRQKLQDEYPGKILDFYEPPLRDKWRSSNDSEISFNVADCQAFGRYPNSVPWAQVVSNDQESFKSIRTRLKHLADAMAARGSSGLPLKSETSHPTPNGRSPREIW